MKPRAHLFKPSVLALLLAGTFLASHSSAAMAQGRDMGCSPTVANPCTGGGGGGMTMGNGGLFGLFKNNGPSKAELAVQEGTDLNNRAIVFFDRGDWASAVPLLEQAAAKSPNDPIIQKNLAHARAQLAEMHARLQREQREVAAAGNMRRAIQDFAQTLIAAPSAGGLDFDGGGAGASGGGLDFTAALAPPSSSQPGCATPSSTMVVDACNVPSGLPKDVEDAIAGVYRNAPPGVSDQIRKGFQAVMLQDWRAARGWFEVALHRDPTNPRLAQLVELAHDAYSTAQGLGPVKNAADADGAPKVPVTREEFEAMRNAEIAKVTPKGRPPAVYYGAKPPKLGPGNLTQDIYLEVTPRRWWWPESSDFTFKK